MIISSHPPRRRRRRPAAGLFFALLNLYAGLLILYLFLRLLFGDRLWPLALISTFLPWLMLPALVFLLLGLLARRWQTVVLSGLNVVAFLWLFGALFLPQLPGPTHSYELTVMTYNVANNAVDPDDLVTMLRETRADLVALTELSEDQAAAIEQRLHDLYPHQVLYSLGTPGKALLSRYPILEEELFYLQAQRLPHLRATIAVEFPTRAREPISVTAIVAQPPPPSFQGGIYQIHPDAAAEIDSLAQMAVGAGPSILLGDLNTTDQNDNYALLSSAGLHDAFRAAGWGLGGTWPVNRGLLQRLCRIDYIWHSAHFHTSQAWIGPDAGSDHLPVLARLAWLGEP